MKPKTVPCLTKFILLAAFAMPAWSPAQQHNEKLQHYTVTDLGTLGGTFSTAQGISEEGWVEGWSLLPGAQTQHSFLWVEGLTTDLGTLGGPNSGGDQGGHFRPNRRGQVPGFGQITILDPRGLGCAFFPPPSSVFRSFGKTV